MDFDPLERFFCGKLGDEDDGALEVSLRAVWDGLTSVESTLPGGDETESVLGVAGGAETSSVGGGEMATVLEEEPAE